MTIDRSTCAAKRHGDYSAYSWFGCRCPDAREVYRVTVKRRRHGRNQPRYVDITGTARRLQALVALGYDWKTLGARLGVDPAQVSRRATCFHSTIHVDIAGRINALFEDLSATPAPRGFAASKALDTARRNGYLPPLAWGDDIDDPNAVPDLGEDGHDIVDDEAIRRVLAGESQFQNLTDAEKTALVRDHLDGWGYKRIRDAFGLHTYAVDTWRTRAGVNGEVAA